MTSKNNDQKKNEKEDKEKKPLHLTVDDPQNDVFDDENFEEFEEDEDGSITKPKTKPNDTNFEKPW